MFLPFTTFDDGTHMFRGTSEFYIMGGQKLKKMCVLVQYARTEKPIFSVWLNWKRFENVFTISKMSEMHCFRSGAVGAAGGEGEQDGDEEGALPPR